MDYKLELKNYLAECEEEGEMPRKPAFLIRIEKSHQWVAKQKETEVKEVFDTLALHIEDALLKEGRAKKTSPIFNIFELKAKHNYQENDVLTLEPGRGVVMLPPRKVDYEVVGGVTKKLE